VKRAVHPDPPSEYLRRDKRFALPMNNLRKKAAQVTAGDCRGYRRVCPECSPGTLCRTSTARGQGGSPRTVRPTWRKVDREDW
jgi:hypothetical protein